MPNNTSPTDATTAPTKKKLSAFDNYFQITDRGSTIGTEVRAGIVTFFAMAYIVLLNPLILGTVPDHTGTQLGIPRVAAVTALAAGVMTISFGLIARYPFGIATGLGINTLVAVTLVSTEGLTWPQAMGLIVIDGIIIVLLAVTGFRVAVFNAIPAPMKTAMTVGIGLFIAIIGFVDGGFVRRIPDSAHTTVPVQLGTDGSIASWPTAVFLVGLLICGVLVARNIRGGLFIGIVSTTIIAMIVDAMANPGPSVENGKPRPTGWNLAVPRIPHSWAGMPDLSLVGNVDLVGAFSKVGALTATLLIFTLVLANFFDAMGTMTGLGKQAGLADDNGVLPNMKQALVVEGTGAIVGGTLSSSSNTVFVDSAAGIADGARTGMANVVTGVLFLAAMFLTPLYEIVPTEAAAPVLVIVGALMVGQIREIDFSHFTTALPAFLTIVVMPFTYSIANGVGIGFITYVVMETAAGRTKKIHPLMWIIAILFIVYFGINPIRDAVS